MTIRKNRTTKQPGGDLNEKQESKDEQKPEASKAVNLKEEREESVLKEEEVYEPILVYRSPGPHPAPGGTFEYMQIRTPQQGEDALKDGWTVSLEEAIAIYNEAKKLSKVSK